MSQFLYFGVDQAYEHYDNVITISGSKTGVLSGVLHRNLLESALAHIRVDDYYPDMTHKLTHLVYSIAKSHCFTDGNKRTAIVLGAYFLTINGYDNLVPKFIVEMENIVLWVAANLVSKDKLLVIIDDLILLGEFSEDTKLGIVGLLDEYADLIKKSGLNG
ncbi:MAG: type II toxin-antitoxin system death-on-curing family toxin [Candidatus Woesebacteria bacterium]|jgi:death-on-curing protein